MITYLQKAMETAIAALKRKSERHAVIVHHNDTDGLSSGAVLQEAFTTVGYTIERYSLEKPYPQVLDALLQDSGRVIVFADFAGRIAPLIAEKNRQRNLVLILDHHPAEPVEDGTVFNLDGELFGIKGDRDISASATCFLFTQALLRSAGFASGHLAHLGVLGAIGDGFLVNGALSGVNRQLLAPATMNGLIRVEPVERGEQYFIRLGGVEYPAGKICTILDTIGGVGYYQKGTEQGIGICLNGMTSQASAFVESLIRKRDELFAAEIETVRREIRTTEHIQWFNVRNRFVPMGIKMIGVFCNMVKDMDFLDPEKYLAGFQYVPDEVPGFGQIPFNSVKISMRVSSSLTEQIRSGTRPSLDSFLPAATERLGGFSDACHGLSAATTVTIGEEEQLIEEMESVLHEMA